MALTAEQQEAQRPWSEIEVLAQLSKAVERLDEEISKLKSFGVAKSQKRDAFDRAEARELLRVQFDHPELKNQDMRKAWVIDQTDVWDLKLEHEKAETLYEDQRTTIRAYQATIDALRSMLRSVRDNQESGGYGYGAGRR